MLLSLICISLCQGNCKKTSQSDSASRRSPSSCLSSLQGKRAFPNLKLCTKAVLAVVPLVSIRLLDLVHQMISATVEPHGEPLTSETCDTDHLRPCELMHPEMRLVPPCLKGPGSAWQALGLKTPPHSALALEQKCKLRIEALLVSGAGKTSTVPPLPAQTMVCGLGHLLTSKFGSSRCDS